MYGVPVASGASPVTPKRSQSSYCFVQSTEANRSGRSDDADVSDACASWKALLTDLQIEPAGGNHDP